MKVNNKTILVTGAGSGMGRQLVIQLAARGAKIIALDRNEAALMETLALASGRKGDVKSFVIDITNREKVVELANKVIDADPVDGVINNAGIIQPFVKLNDLPFETIEKVINVNFYGCLNIVKAFLPHLLSRPEAHIVNVSSMGGFLPVPGQTIYGASKAAVKLLTEGLRSELVDTQVKVSVVFPGAVITNIVSNSGLTTIPGSGNGDSKPPKVLTSEKAAEIIIDGMEQDRYHILVGSDAKSMYWLSRLNPSYAAKLIYTKMSSILSK